MGFTLEFSIGSGCKKTRIIPLPDRQKCDDMYTHNTGIGQTDGRQTDGIGKTISRYMAGMLTRDRNRLIFHGNLRRHVEGSAIPRTLCAIMHQTAVVHFFGLLVRVVVYPVVWLVQNIFMRVHTYSVPSLQCSDTVGWKGIRYVKTVCWFVGGDDLTGLLHVLLLQLSPPPSSSLAPIKSRMRHYGTG